MTEPQPVAAHGLLLGFTSLGDNCEFALVQRRAGVETLGLLRFAFSKIDPLIESMRDGFADLDPLTTVSIEQPWTDEYVSFFGRRGFFQHTFMRTGSIDPARLAQQETQRVPFLRRRLIEDLQAAETIFVRKSNTHAPGEMTALYDAMRRYGNTALLWVEQADDAHPPGSVEQLRSGLLRGYVDRFAPYGDATAVSFACWLGLCLRSRRLLRGDLPTPPPSPAPIEIGLTASLHGSTNAASLCGSTNAASLCGSTDVDCGPTDAVPALRRGVAVFRHAASAACRGIVAALSPAAVISDGQVFAACLWSWVPDSFRGRLIAPTIVGATAPTTQPAVLLDCNRWQQIWVTGCVPAGQPLRIEIWAEMEQGDVFYTTHWTIEPSETPATYLLDAENAGP